ncbi:helix-turn-helix domain-containing protein [Pseudomonas sp. PSKL.D1]|uniref:helix-turn-helix domain-containing protein n=1 Tax=Pseudomonas sp. PSKL.D1 TaxID=3029060 RepID=UPI0023814BF5|nr:helix-turn-helix domain-containing protein [Pseudomonas sp. PSKL.D1]WDY60603.1 helix-turn-helix domain-containing protein [Pseudomonas sp. PSKL.D1]
MVQIEEVRESFAARLREALAANDIQSWGAGARLAKIAGVTPKASSKWLNGEAMPGGAKMLALADALKVRAEWLEYGRGPMRDGAGALPFMIGAAVGPVFAAVSAADGSAIPAAGPRAGVDLFVESNKDAEFLEKVIAGVPMFARIHRVLTALSAMDKEEAESIARQVVGCQKHATEILILLDSVLEAAVYQAMDPEEIQAITTLVQKRRSEKVHGAGLESKEK